MSRFPSAGALGAWLILVALSALPALADGDRVEASQETLLLQQPTVSAEHIVFVYANDLWIVDREGGTARRLTSHPGREDHLGVALHQQYQGNSDVYVMPVTGGTPRRLTWHPSDDYVRAWHPDGKRILMLSDRASGPPVRRLFEVPLDGGNPTMLAIPRAKRA